MRMLYKYPQVEYPYARLVEENRRRSRAEPEFELFDALGEALPRGPLLRRLRRVCQGRPGGHPLPGHGDQPGAGAGRAARPAARSGSATPGLGPRPAPARAPGRRTGPHPGRAPPPRRAVVVSRRGAGHAQSCCSPRTRRTPSGSSASPNASPLRQGRLPRLRGRRPSATG